MSALSILFSPIHIGSLELRNRIVMSPMETGFGTREGLPSPRSLDYWVWFPGVGFGDVKLLAMIGAVIGPLGALETILAASFAGLVLGIGWAAVTRQWNAPFGFAPALAAGALLVVLADLIARVLSPDVDLPLGSLTALVGAPYFLLALRRAGAATVGVLTVARAG